MIFIVDDDRMMAECIARAIRAEDSGAETKIFRNGIEAMAAIVDEIPEMIFLDVLLDGPDGFTFLNELMSYEDTEKIPVVVVSGIRFEEQSLKDYGVVGVLDKATMYPEQIRKYVRKYTGKEKNGGK
ncbi:response regulator [Candidatus Saccharibacteria bacterium]|nr:response regulator [Candidatus Saccharibacteria bacterium]